MFCDPLFVVGFVLLNVMFSVLCVLFLFVGDLSFVFELLNLMFFVLCVLFLFVGVRVACHFSFLCCVFCFCLFDLL